MKIDKFEPILICAALMLTAACLSVSTTAASSRICAENENAGGDPAKPRGEPTALNQWPPIQVPKSPDCGVGCRVLLDYPIYHPMNYGHAHSRQFVADVNTRNGLLLIRKLTDKKTRIAASRSVVEEGYGQPFACKEKLIFLHVQPGNLRDIVVLNTENGEKKVVFSYVKQSVEEGVSRTLLDAHRAFWYIEGRGLMSQDLRSGENRLLTAQPLSCFGIGISGKDILCCDLESSRFLAIDQEKGNVGYLSPGPGLQVDGSVSIDGTFAAWIDYRDPPGLNSDAHFHRSGGEVYIKDLVKSETRRLTYDSPEKPRGKTIPLISDNLVVWHETPHGRNPNPATGQELYTSATALVGCDLKTQKKFRIEQSVAGLLRFPVLKDRKLYGYWMDANGQIWLVEVDFKKIKTEAG